MSLLLLNLTPHSRHLQSVLPGLEFGLCSANCVKFFALSRCSAHYFVNACWSACKAFVLYVYHQLGANVSISLVRVFYQEKLIVQVSRGALSKNKYFKQTETQKML